MLFDPRKGLHIVDINEAYGAATMTSSAKIAGSPLFDVFPDTPEDPMADGVSHLFASLTKVAERGIVDAMSIQRYDARNPEGSFVTKFWETGQQADFRYRG
ncbi:hypothetical protein [Sinorhizobium fredii]|uniref:hypothetical protein n=1 Tax=Rhizobium fredii TaxID=380 RepID=UPI0004B12BD6|nr:hypothetical protein [Sinorhizobium fredii]